MYKDMKNNEFVDYSCNYSFLKKKIFFFMKIFLFLEFLVLSMKMDVILE